MSVDIPPQFLPFVQKTIAAGRFESESAMLGEALRLLQEQEELRHAIEKGFDQIERGECIELSEEELEEYFEGLVRHGEERASVKRNVG